jgi:extradiol dioxygenase family protein
MSVKIHLHMHVSDLTKSREFYEKFLGGSDGSRRRCRRATTAFFR